MSGREAHLELLLGKRVRARNGRSVGRLEEVRAEPRGEEYVVTEYHLGTEALLERLQAGALALLGVARKARGYRARWDQLDIGEPDRIRLTCSMDELEELEPGE